jgi:hypothetical protein
MAGLENVIVDGKYNSLKERFITNFKEYNYLFEISKCCGYSELVSCTKEDTLKKLYENIFLIFRNKNIKLFIMIEDKKVWIPNSSDIFTKDYIQVMNAFLKPEYPIPCDIIYKIYIDDGHCQTDHKPPGFIHVTCDFHGKTSK